MTQKTILGNKISAVSNKDKNQKKGRVVYGFHPSPFGECFVALFEESICAFHFIGRKNRQQILSSFQKKWKPAKIYQDQECTKRYVQKAFQNKKKMSLLLRGTTFQQKVWKTLLKIPRGTTVTYEAIAKKIKHPAATRAVANAIGANPIGYLIPCHRVIRKDGGLGGYRWGIQKKNAMLASEGKHSL